MIIIKGEDSSPLGLARKRLVGILSSGSASEIEEAIADFNKLLLTDELKRQELEVLTLAQTQREIIIKKDRMLFFNIQKV